MHFKGQTAVLSAIFVVVGMMFLVPVITEKALAAIHATAEGVCGLTRGIATSTTGPCHFTLVGSHLDFGQWTSQPTQSGTVVTWSTNGGNPIGDEKGSVTYKVTGPLTEETAVLSFDNPVFGSNKCSISGMAGSCTGPGKGYNADFTYNLRGR